MKKQILVVSDNIELTNSFHLLITEFEEVEVTYSCSFNNSEFLKNKKLLISATMVNMKEQWRTLAEKYDLIFSLHCKQLFPAELVKKIRCINIHPGFNPYNRGWYPQVFSILNEGKAGATIHEIDEQLDHGSIIAQKEIKILAHDTSLSAYQKIQQAEIELLEENIKSIIHGNYKSFAPKNEGNINLKRDFNALRQIDLEKPTTMRAAINYLRAMTHGDYKNAYFLDENGSKIFVSIQLNKE